MPYQLVPQCSVLGPLLLLTIPDGILVIFADDTVVQRLIYVPMKITCCYKIRDGWIVRLHLQFNGNKWKCMILSGERTYVKVLSRILNLGGRISTFEPSESGFEHCEMVSGSG